MATQHETLSLYAALTMFEPHWPGKLLLSVGMNGPLALAALAAGAATLILEQNTAMLKQARQHVTFTVTTLDEALRALKNEVRQQRAITVALTGNAEVWLQEMLERGVQPDVIAANEASVRLADFLQRGARSFQPDAAAAIREDVAATLQERHAQDKALIDTHPEQRRWLQAAPTLFPRDLVRAYLLD